MIPWIGSMKNVGLRHFKVWKWTLKISCISTDVNGTFNLVQIADINHVDIFLELKITKYIIHFWHNKNTINLIVVIIPPQPLNSFNSFCLHFYSLYSFSSANVMMLFLEHVSLWGPTVDMTDFPTISQNLLLLLPICLLWSLCLRRTFKHL